jgi:hypothetical protein
MAGPGAGRRAARAQGWRRRLRRADRRAARAGERSLPDATACLCGMLLAKVLCSEELCNCTPGRARVRGMRHLYAMLQWISQRVAAAVRGCPQRRCAGLGQRWVHLCWPAPHLWPRRCTCSARFLRDAPLPAAREPCLARPPRHSTLQPCRRSRGGRPRSCSARSARRAHTRRARASTHRWVATYRTCCTSRSRSSPAAECPGCEWCSPGACCRCGACARRARLPLAGPLGPRRR